MLGYDIVESKLVVNRAEARRVRQIFALYLQQGSLSLTLAAIEGKGWRNKRWTTKQGSARGGKPFDKSSLHKLLTNVVYIGQVCHRRVAYDGEHQAIVDPESRTSVPGGGSDDRAISPPFSQHPHRQGGRLLDSGRAV